MKFCLFLILLVETNKTPVFNRLATVGNSLVRGYASATSEMGEQIHGVDFEVFGRVQGVFFRKYTQKQATSLGLTGWCMNTYDDTVKGQIEGPAKPLNEMKHWLENVGSPSSKVDRAVFSEMKPIAQRKYTSFQIKH